MKTRLNFIYKRVHDDECAQIIDPGEFDIRVVEDNNVEWMAANCQIFDDNNMSVVLVFAIPTLLTKRGPLLEQARWFLNAHYWTSLTNPGCIDSTEKTSKEIWALLLSPLSASVLED